LFVTRKRTARGFTLIELLIGIAIFALLALLGAPIYFEMIVNSELRNAAENALSGVRGAQAEAIRMNLPVKFEMSSNRWDIYATDPEALTFNSVPLRSYSLDDGARRALFKPVPAGTTTVTFNGFGQVLPKNLDNSKPLEQIDIGGQESVSKSGLRELRVIIGTQNKATAMKLCDPSFSNTDPMGCPEKSASPGMQTVDKRGEINST
jgi:type IV fimbrial biogenesis protein FimT